MKKRFKTAFIFGAGLGMRLYPLTKNCPKPLIKIKGRPIISYVMDHLLEIGIERFIVNTHYLPELYLKEFPEKKYRGIPIQFSYESNLLETAGGLKNIEDLLSNDETIICYNGDVISNIPLQKLISAHEEMKPEITLVLRSKGNLLNIEIKENGEICDIRNVLANRGIMRCQFTGIYAVETSFLKYLTKDKVESIVFPMIRSIIERPGSIRGIIIDERDWYEIGSLEDYYQLNRE